MATAKAAKCAHPICSCVTTSGKYCSTQCEAMEKTPDIECSCGYTVCKVQNVLIRNVSEVGERAVRG